MICPKMTHTISTVAKNWHCESFSQKKVTHHKKNYGATNFSVFHDFFIIPSEFLTYPKIKKTKNNSFGLVYFCVIWFKLVEIFHFYSKSNFFKAKVYIIVGLKCILLDYITSDKVKIQTFLASKEFLHRPI
jgi:hypothetical protein